MGHIQRHHLSDARVIVPPKNVLQKMDNTVNPLFQKIKSNTQQIRTLTQLRDTLLPKLMSGEVRLNYDAFDFSDEQDSGGVKVKAIIQS
jgi:type I restriction enzyme S subunit